jgi:hypothetical protein
LGGSKIVLVTREEARSLVEAMIAEVDLPEDDVAVIIDAATIEKDWGWVFFYESRRFLETGNHSSRLAGNAPIIVNARTGAAAHTGTAYPVEHYITEYEREHGLA